MTGVQTCALPILYDTICKKIDIVKSKRKNEKVYLIFLGDVFHKEMPNVTAHNGWTQTMTKLRAKVNGIFCVVGNHEISYKTDNPFWSLANEVQSDKVRAKGLEAIGTLPIFTIVDHVDIYDTRLHFNHYGTNIDNISTGTNILLAHDYWSSPGILNSLCLEIDDKTMKKYTKGNTIDDQSVLKFFKYCFFGHNHLLYGTFDIGWDDDSYSDTRLFYLGSLGLTQKGEVQKTNSERMLPVIHVTEEGTNIDIEYINLLTHYKEVLDVSETKKTEEMYERTKTLTSLLDKYVLNGRNPIDIVRSDIKIGRAHV